MRARKAVIFASGGFTHDVELRRNHLAAPVFGGCAALTNEGDFVRIGTPLGAQLRNMNYAWMCPVPLEKAVNRDATLSGMFSVAGDSMLFVDKRGRRVVNEKLPYNELAQKFFEWDATAGEYPNLVLMQVWDQRSQEHSASDEYGRLITGETDGHVLRGETFEELQAAVSERLAQYAHVTGGLTLADDWAAQLQASVARFNELAETGVDSDFGRGERAVQQLFNGDVREEPGRSNPTLWPLSRIRPLLRRAGHGRHAGHQGRARRRTPRRACSTTSTSRSPASTGSATAWRASLAGRTGRAGPRSARCSPSPTARRRPRTPSRSRAPRSRAPCHREENPRWL